MAKTSAERQAAYRAKRAGEHSDERRLNTWVSKEVYAAIDKLAIRYGVTRKSVIELLVANEDGKLKELKAKGALLSEAAGEAKVSLLRGNVSQKAAPKTSASKKSAPKKAAPKKVAAKKTAQKNHSAEKLLRNPDGKGSTKKTDSARTRKQWTAPKNDTDSHKAQFELEL